ncbi:MAG: uroporphyrinogen-III synthase [Bacteroidetes bacterium]|nr:MAG: uroporphyrinogen-III synthase [Bacteroidota bacterium]
MNFGLMDSKLWIKYNQLLKEVGFVCDPLPLLEFEYPEKQEELMGLISHEQVPIVLTSGRAFKVLKDFAQKTGMKPSNLYVVGKSTAEHIKKLGWKIVAEAENCESLIAKVSWDQELPLIYLCGNLRRDILPDFWRKNQVSFIEKAVYKTLLTYLEVDFSRYEFALLASPSSVRSLTQNNRFTNEFLFASIGPLTTTAIRKAGYENIIESSDLTISTLINQLNELFHNKTSNSQS